MATVTRERELLRELVALVRGECPSLLNEDSGGDVRLSMAIDDALASPPAEDELQRHDCETWAMEGIGCAHCNPVALAIRAAQAPPASDPPGLASLTRSLCEALWDMQSSPDCWCPHDRAVTEPHTEACAAARAVNGAAKRFHLYDELPLPASPQAKED